MRRDVWAAPAALLLILASGCGTRAAENGNSTAAAVRTEPTSPGQFSTAGPTPAVTTPAAVTQPAGQNQPKPASPLEHRALSGGATSNSSVPVKPSAGAGLPATASPGPVANPGPPKPGALSPGAAPAGDVVIGSVGNYSGVPGSVFGEAPRVLQAWGKAVGDRGGIRGHRIRVIAVDDANDSARHRAIVQDLVERHGVQAFVGVFAPLTGRASIDYLNSKRVPVIGGLVSDAWFATSPMHFAQAGAYENYHFGSIAAVAQVAVAEGKNKVGLLGCAEAATCQEAPTFWERFAPEVGLEVTYKARASISQPDFTAECLAARNSGAEILMIGLDGNSVRRLAASCSRQGYHPILSTPSGAFDTAMLQDPNLDGFVVGLDVYPFFLDGIAAAADFRDTVLKPLHINNGSVAMDVWVSAELLKRALLIGPAEASSAGLLEGLWSIQDDTVGGLAQPLSFPRRDAGNIQRRCWFVAQIQKGRFSSPDGGRLSCA